MFVYMDENIKKILKSLSSTIKHLSLDAIHKAQSGHIGIAMGCADISAYLYGILLNHNPKSPHWLNRDRFILSAGHGSILLYSCLHLSGFNISLDQIKNFRQLDSITPGHPEFGKTEGVEATTGPLGQGLGNAVGIALGMKIAQDNFNTKKISLFDNKIYCLIGDGCIMEGVSSEVSSLAGHWGLNNLIVIYDSNDVCLDGTTNEVLSEDVKKRYNAYNWDVYEIDGHDFDCIHNCFKKIKSTNQTKPILVITKTTIGKGIPNKEGSVDAHGDILKQHELDATKINLKISKKEFFIPNKIKQFFKIKLDQQKIEEKKWQDKFVNYKKEHPDLFTKILNMLTKKIDANELKTIFKKNTIDKEISSREASNIILNQIIEHLPFLYSGSADLSKSDKTNIKSHKFITKNNFKEKNIKYGVREFAMGTISNGLYLSQLIVPLCGSFLVFSDYLRNSIRIAALSKYKIIYQFTHDSIFVGEDGPTHQPIEHIVSLRAIPYLQVIRPATNWEVKLAWKAALSFDGPTALILSRQNIKNINAPSLSFDKSLGKGAYIIKKEAKDVDVIIMASGSEVFLALEVANKLELVNKHARVISFPCWELFEKQHEIYKKELLKEDVLKVSIEAGSDIGWHKYIGSNGIAININAFGTSAPSDHIAQKIGFTTSSIFHLLYENLTK